MRNIVAIIALLFVSACVRGQGTVTGSGTVSGSGTMTVSSHVPSGSCAAGLPCALGWYQIPNSAISTLNPGFADIQGQTGQTAVETAWGSALWDNARSRFIITGGGHGDYFGNEMYAVDFTTTPISISLLHGPSHGSTFDTQLTSGSGYPQLGGGSANNVGCPEAVVDGSGKAPNARHPYDSFQYLPNLDRYWYSGGGLAGSNAGTQCGSFTDGVWAYDPNASTWTQFNLTNHPATVSNGSVGIMAYNQTDSNIYFLENNIPNFWKNGIDASNLLLNNTNENWSALTSPSGAPCDNTNPSSDIDVSRQLYVCVGGGALYTIALSNSAVVNDTSATGCSTPANAAAPGVAYDPVQKLIVIWTGGSNIYTYNATAHTCSTISSYTTNAPGAELTNGTLGRFRYAPALGGFVLANGVSNPIYFLRLTDAATAALTDFNNRVAASGATASEGFDSSNTFVQTTSGRGFWLPNGATLFNQDTGTYRSGGSSAHCGVPPKSSDQPCGWYALPFAFNLTSGHAVEFSWAQKVDAAYIQEAAPAVGGGSTYWKQFIVSYFDGNNNFQSCANPDLVMVNSFNEGYPFTYMACGGDGLQVTSSLAPNNLFNEFTKPLISSGTYNGTTQTLTGGSLPTVNYNCPYGVSQPNANCFDYPANVWVTYKCRVDMGTFGTASSTIQCWVSTPTSMAWRQIVYSPSHIITQDNPAYFLNVFQVQPYWTARDATQNPTPNLGTANTWYDELIVCRDCVIPPPSTPPAAP